MTSDLGMECRKALQETVHLNSTIRAEKCTQDCLPDMWSQGTAAKTVLLGTPERLLSCLVVLCSRLNIPVSATLSASVSSQPLVSFFIFLDHFLLGSL